MYGIWILNLCCKNVDEMFLRCLGNIFTIIFSEISWIYLCLKRRVEELDYMTLGHKYEIISYLIFDWNRNQSKIWSYSLLFTFALEIHRCFAAAKFWISASFFSFLALISTNLSFSFGYEIDTLFSLSVIQFSNFKM